MRAEEVKYGQLKAILFEKRPEAQPLFEFLENELGFLIAPASSEYHCSYRGGLLAHSVSVVTFLLKLRVGLGVGKQYGVSVPSCILVGLAHDVGKLGTKGRPQYSDKGQGEYKRNEDTPPVHLEHAVRSLEVVSRFVSLSTWEAQAIVGHDGQYIPLNRWMALKENPLTVLLHVADIWSAQFVETTYCIPNEIWLPGGENDD